MLLLELKSDNVRHMKTLTCDICDFQASGETFENWMEALKPHYAEAHADIMKQKGLKPKDEQMAEMQQWMIENRARVDAQH
jgi:hypothetical protein